MWYWFYKLFGWHYVTMSTYSDGRKVFRVKETIPGTYVVTNRGETFTLHIWEKPKDWVPLTFSKEEFDTRTVFKKLVKNGKDIGAEDHY